MSDSSVSGATQPGGETESLEQRVINTMRSGRTYGGYENAMAIEIVALVREQIVRDIKALRLDVIGLATLSYNNALDDAAQAARNGASS